MENQFINGEFFQNFEEIAAGKNLMVHVGDLDINKQYRIKQFRFLNAKNGKCLAVDFEDGTWTILPQRLSKIVETDDQITALTNKQYSLFLKGKDEKRMNMAILDFRVVPVATFNISDAGVPMDLLAELMAEINEEPEALKPKAKKMKR